MPDQSVITRRVTVAAGVFAPGHLGELTQVVPFEMVDEALAETGRVQSRIRALPSRVAVYLLLAGALFADCGYGQVWDRLVAGLDRVGVPDPSGGGLAAARRRVGGGAAAVPVRSAARCGGDLGVGVGPLVRAVGLRDRRDDHECVGQPGDPGPVP